MRRASISESELAAILLDTPHPRSAPIELDGKKVLPLDVDPEAKPLCWEDLFGNANPVEIEIGFGKGLFLLNASRTKPNVNFVGIEIERKYVLHTAARLVRLGADNVRLACTDARWFLRTRVSQQSVQAVHVYFPDPWWKSRHKKRLLFTHEFAQQVERVLAPGGQLHFVSDVREYFHESQEILRRDTRLQSVPPPPMPEGKDELDYLTNFERKYRAQGREIHRSCWQRELD